MTEENEKTKPKSVVSRREFIKGTVGGAAVLGAMTALTPGVTATSVNEIGSGAFPAGNPGTVVRDGPTSVPTTWSQTADVVVVGTGLGGLAAAVSAYDAGASVLILEKLSQDLEGGSSKVSNNQFAVFTRGPAQASNGTLLNPDPVNGAAYLQAEASGTVEDEEIFAAEAQGFIDNLAWVQALGGNVGTYTTTATYTSAAGASSYHTFCIALPAAPVQSNGYPQGSSGDARLWQLFRDNVAKRGINVLYQTPAMELIQDPMTGEILGVQALANASQVLNIKANRGVVLACGSIEFALDLQKQWWPAWPVYSLGCPGNTGDGVRMALKVGADLWHMSYGFGSFQAFVVPGTDPSVFGVAPCTPLGILVNKFGNRFNNGNAVNGPLGGFANELGVGTTYDTTTLDWDSVPSWAIFDDTARKKTCTEYEVQTTSTTVGVGGKDSWWTYHSGMVWSSDNSAEVAKGWILSANDLNTLAATIAADPDNKGKMTGAQLSATVAAYNTDVANKADAQFFTSLSAASPINGPPFYAMKVWPNNIQPSAGPRRNIKCQIVDPSKQPIPRLYSAGELGAFWGWVSNSGSHLAECMWTGRVAGTNAAAELPWT